MSPVTLQKIYNPYCAAESWYLLQSFFKQKTIKWSVTG